MSSNGLPTHLLDETIWLEANRYHEAERSYQELIAQQHRQISNPGVSQSSLASEIACARQKIQNFLKSDDVVDKQPSLRERIEKLEQESEELKQQLASLTSQLNLHLNQFTRFEKICENVESSQKVKNASLEENYHNGPAKEDDDLYLFGSNNEAEEDTSSRQEILKAYENKKAKKPAIVAKSSVLLEVKPWDDDTNMEEMEKSVRKIEADGLTWGASTLVPLAYGIKKLQIVAIVEDDKVSIDWLQEVIQDIEDMVQSVDIAAFNKL